jgi:hypothetical protein
LVILRYDEDASGETYMTPDAAEAAVEAFAAEAHNAWRRQMLKDNPAQRGKPRMRLRGGKMVDVNQPWAKLDPKAQQDNRQAARDALQAIEKFPSDREAASAHVHKMWVQRNKADPNQPAALLKAYSSLPETEKDKDRAHVDRMGALLAEMARAKKAQARTRSARKPERRPADRARARTVRLAPEQWRQIEAVASLMALQRGRSVTAEEAGQLLLTAMLGALDAVGLTSSRK